MTANTVTPGQPSLVSLIVTLNNGQSYPVQFLLPPGITPNLTDYAKLTDLSNYVSSTLNFDATKHSKALSLRYDNTLGTPVLLYGSAASPSSVSLLTSSNGVSGVTGSSTINGDKAGISLYQSGASSMPVFTYGTSSSSSQAYLLSNYPNSSDFLNALSPFESSDGKKTYSNGVGGTVGGQSAYIQAQVNNDTNLTSALINVTDENDHRVTVLEARQDGALISAAGNTLIENIGGKTQWGIQAFRVTGTGGDPTITFPKSFSGVPIVTAMVTREGDSSGQVTRGVCYDVYNSDGTKPIVTATNFQIQIPFFVSGQSVGGTGHNWSVDVIAIGPV